MVTVPFFEKPKKKDKFEPLPLYIDIPMPSAPEELQPKEKEEKEQRGVIIIEIL